MKQALENIALLTAFIAGIWGYSNQDKVCDLAKQAREKFREYKAKIEAPAKSSTKEKEEVYWTVKNNYDAQGNYTGKCIYGKTKRDDTNSTTSAETR